MRKIIFGQRQLYGLKEINLRRVFQILSYCQHKKRTDTTLFNKFLIKFEL